MFDRLVLEGLRLISFQMASMEGRYRNIQFVKSIAGRTAESVCWLACKIQKHSLHLWMIKNGCFYKKLFPKRTSFWKVCEMKTMNVRRRLSLCDVRAPWCRRWLKIHSAYRCKFDFESFAFIPLSSEYVLSAIADLFCIFLPEKQAIQIGKDERSLERNRRMN